MTPSHRGSPPPLVRRPQALHELAPGLALARGGPGRTLNVYLLGTVILDSGVRWSRRRLARQLAGRQLTAHLLTHAHFDHAGSSAWLCHTFNLPLWCGAGDAAAIASGRIDSHGSPLANRLQRTPSAGPSGRATWWQGSRCWRSPDTHPGRWRSGASGTGC